MVMVVLALHPAPAIFDFRFRLFSTYREGEVK
jgi:hypothetical protein